MYHPLPHCELSYLAIIGIDIMGHISQVCALLVPTLSQFSSQAPGDENGRCTDADDAPTYPDTVRNLMDSYNYEQLLRDNGPHMKGGAWTERSVDENDVFDTISPTSVRQI